MRPFLIAIACIAASSGAAQESGTNLPFLVNVTANGADCGNFTVVLFKNNEQVAELPPTKHSAFQLELEFQQHFSVRVGKPGYRDKTITVDTHVPAGEIADEPVAYTVDLEPLDRFAHADPFYLDFPCGIVQWSNETGRFDHSEHYMADIQLKMALLTAQAVAE